MEVALDVFTVKHKIVRYIYINFFIFFISSFVESGDAPAALVLAGDEQGVV